MTCFIYNTYIAGIIITYVTTSSTSPTSPTSSAPSSLHHHYHHHHHHHHQHHHHHLSHLHHLHHLPTPFLSAHLHDMHHLQRIHALHHHLYRCIPTSPTSSNLSNLTSLTRLTTSWSSSTIYIDNDTYISYRWSTSRELLQNLKNVVYTGVDLQVIHFYLNSYKSPACKVICTEIVAQELLHRSSANFQWSNCMWTPAKQTSPVLLFLSGGSDSQAVAYETLPSAACRIPKRVAKCGSCLSLGPQQPFAETEIAQVGHPNTWQNANLAGPGAAPSHEMRVNHQKLVYFESSDASVAWKLNGNNCGKTELFLTSDANVQELV